MEAFDADAVKAAIGSFHAALTSLDVNKIKSFWARDSYVTMINPLQKSIAVGPDAVMKYFEETIKAIEQLKLSFSEGPYIHINGNVAWATGIVQGNAKLKNGQTLNDNVFESDIFEKQNGRWLLVSHNALRMGE